MAPVLTTLGPTQQCPKLRELAIAQIPLAMPFGGSGQRISQAPAHRARHVSQFTSPVTLLVGNSASPAPLPPP